MKLRLILQKTRNFRPDLRKLGLFLRNFASFLRIFAFFFPNFESFLGSFGLFLRNFALFLGKFGSKLLKNRAKFSEKLPKTLKFGSFSLSFEARTLKKPTKLNGFALFFNRNAAIFNEIGPFFNENGVVFNRDWGIFNDRHSGRVDESVLPAIIYSVVGEWQALLRKDRQTESCYEGKITSGQNPERQASFPKPCRQFFVDSLAGFCVKLCLIFHAKDAKAFFISQCINNNSGFSKLSKSKRN